MPTPIGVAAADRNGDHPVSTGAPVGEAGARGTAGRPACERNAPTGDRVSARRRSRPGRRSRSRRTAAGGVESVVDRRKRLLGRVAPAVRGSSAWKLRRPARAQTRIAIAEQPVSTARRGDRRRPRHAGDACTARLPAPLGDGVGIVLARRKDQDEPGVARAPRSHARPPAQARRPSPTPSRPRGCGVGV